MYDTYRNDNAPETLVFFSVCRNCGWQDDCSHEYQADCEVSICPECGSDDISDESEYI